MRSAALLIFCLVVTSIQSNSNPLKGSTNCQSDCSECVTYNHCTKCKDSGTMIVWGSCFNIIFMVLFMIFALIFIIVLLKLICTEVKKCIDQDPNLEDDSITNNSLAQPMAPDNQVYHQVFPNSPQMPAFPGFVNPPPPPMAYPGHLTVPQQVNPNNPFNSARNSYPSAPDETS